jgi:hypothetical protein
MDDPFDEIVAGLELDQPSDAISVRDLNDVELSNHFNETRDELLALGEMQQPTTDRGRELHSIRTACLVEIRRRQASR